MLTFKSKVILGIGSLSVVIALLAGALSWRVSRDQAEAHLVAIAVDQSRQLLSQDSYRPLGPQAMPRAQNAARIMSAGHGVFPATPSLTLKASGPHSSAGW
jgi:hypothetical protein